MRFAIALECLILPIQSEELAYRLSLRVAWLFEENGHQRMKFAKRIKELYALRSKIVHSGSYEVAEKYRNDVCCITKNAILRLLTDPDVERCHKPEELHEYFEKLTFK